MSGIGEFLLDFHQSHLPGTQKPYFFHLKGNAISLLHLNCRTYILANVPPLDVPPTEARRINGPHSWAPLPEGPSGVHDVILIRSLKRTERSRVLLRIRTSRRLSFSTSHKLQ